MKLRRAEYLAAREFDLNRREFIAKSQRGSGGLRRPRGRNLDRRQRTWRGTRSDRLEGNAGHGAAGTGTGGPANANRDTPMSGIEECSFATIAIDRSGTSPVVTIEYRSAWTGNVLLTKKLTLADLGEAA